MALNMTAMTMKHADSPLTVVANSNAARTTGKQSQQQPKQEDSNSDDDPSLNSSYADVFEASSVVIRDYGGSFSKGPMAQNDVTYNLTKCKSNVVVPYFKLLCVIAWRRFEGCSHWGMKVWNYLYTFLCFCILIFWYVIRVITCNGRLVVEKRKINPQPTPSTTPFIPNATWVNLSVLTNASYKAAENTTLFLNPCNHIFGTYIVPNFLHLSAFLIGFYHFRIKEHEGLYVLMEKVYLQSRNPSKMTKRLRYFIYMGVLWLVLCLGSNIHYFFAIGLNRGTGIPPITKPYLSYTMVALITISNIFANCVNLAVILSYCGQCELLKYYIDGIAERLAERSTELKTAMKELLDVQRHFKRLNGSLSYCMSLLTFDATIVVIIDAILLFNFLEMEKNIWIYRLVTVIEGLVYLAFVFIQATSVTSRPQKILHKALSCRVFGYQSHSESDIDSFLNFVHKVDLQAELFTIPMKSKYLWGTLIIGVQVIILVVQTGGLIDEHSKWL